LFAVLLFNGLRCAVFIVDTRKWSLILCDPFAPFLLLYICLFLRFMA